MAWASLVWPALICGLLAGISPLSAEEVESACSRAKEALDEASRLRGLAIKRTVPCESLDPEAFLKRIQKNQAEFMDPRAAWFDELYYKALAFIPSSYPYAECLQKALSENIHAFYDVISGSIVVPAEEETRYGTLVHESVHALQDQHFCLQCLREKIPRGSDYALAFASLVEGDAQSVQEEVAKDTPSPQRAPASPEAEKKTRCQLPQTLAFQYEFPYTVGRRFVGRLKQKGEDLNALFSNIPQNSSVILYAYSKRPELAAFEASIPKPDMEAPYLAKDVFGEYSIRTMLRDANGSRGAVLAALGWRGDILLLTRQGAKSPDAKNPDTHSYTLSWRTEWRSAGDARQFYEAFLRHQRKNIPLRFSLPNPAYMSTAIAPPDITLCQTINVVKGGTRVDIKASLALCEQKGS